MLSRTIRALVANDPRTNAEIGRLAGIGAGHLSRYLNHGATLSTEKLDALVDVFGLALMGQLKPCDHCASITFEIEAGERSGYPKCTVCGRFKEWAGDLSR